MAQFSGEAKGDQLARADRRGWMSAADFRKLDSMQVPVSRLAYGPAIDHLNATVVTAGAWTDIHANQSFTVGSATAWLEVEIKLGLLATSGAVTQITARALFNSAGTPLAIPFSPGVIPAAGGYGVLSGSTFKIPPGLLPVGTNTLKLQVFARSANITAYCRSSSEPNTDFLGIRVTELSA